MLGVGINRVSLQLQLHIIIIIIILAKGLVVSEVVRERGSGGVSE